MSNLSGSNQMSSPFILVGIPGMEEMHPWISVPLCCMYIVTISANVSVLLIIRADRRLHQPMYLLLSMLLLTDLVQSNAALPKMLLIFWFKLREITFEECLVQMFFIHSFPLMGSSVLLTMAFDRYVAICHPLRYSTILTNSMIVKMGLFVIIRGILVEFPLPFLVRMLPFCGSRVIQHTYCEHMAVAKLSCGDIRINPLYGLVSLVMAALDLICVAGSYTMIIMAVLRLPNREARYKVGNTCSAHVGLILIAYIPALFSFISQRIEVSSALSVQILVSSLYLIIPPMCNPIIYGIKTQEIRKKVSNLISLPAKGSVKDMRFPSV
uniref:G-protein coupled receptors family 1 profile domain-containing protein n=1 Tax=Xenopus tropicalis TaxID=8364 RepID=F6VGF7_XENTR|eukprot:XP_002942083.4 PREDICTED: olfactory receptor 52K1-like [Xenopus tropicalis]